MTVGERQGWVSERALSVPPSKIRRMFNRAAELPDVINLAVGQPDFDTPPHVLEAARLAAERGETKYTHGLGIPALREATAEKVRTRNHIPAEYGWMAITVGAMEGIILAMLTVLQPGDEVLIPDPGYTNFAGQVLLAGATPVSYGLEPPDYGIDEATLRAQLSDRTRAILLCSPSNPTGAVLDRRSIETVARIAQEHNLLVFSDETYEDLIYEGEHVSIGSLPGMAERTVSIFSFSKTFAMTGWRVGYVAAPPEVITTMNALQEHVVLVRVVRLAARGARRAHRSAGLRRRDAHHLRSTPPEPGRRAERHRRVLVPAAPRRVLRVPGYQRDRPIRRHLRGLGARRGARGDRPRHGIQHAWRGARADQLRGIARGAGRWSGADQGSAGAAVEPDSGVASQPRILVPFP